MNIKKYLLIEEAEIDFEKADLGKIFDFISKKIERKPNSEKAEMYKSMVSELIKEMQDLPQGNMALKKILKYYRKEM